MPQELNKARHAHQMSYAEVRQVMVGVDKVRREPVIKDLYHDVVGAANKPAPPPRHFTRLYEEWNNAPPDRVADMVVPDLAARWIVCVMNQNARYERTVAEGRTDVEPVPAQVLHEVQAHPDFQAVMHLHQIFPEYPFGGCVDRETVKLGARQLPWPVSDNYDGRRG
jgi:hypothetical protein